MSNNIKPLKEGVRKNNQEKPNPVVKKSDVAKPPAAISDNKQSMKLYTEEQLQEAIKMAREGIRSEDNIIGSLNFINPAIELPSDSICINCDESKSTHNICMDCIIKVGKENIELPSDEEIENHIEDNFYKSERVHKYTEKEQLLMKATTISGAKWMRDKIQGGNK